MSEELNKTEEVKIEQSVENKDEKNSYQKRIDELVSRAKAAEAKLTELESKSVAEAKAKEEAILKEKGNYEELVKKISEEREQEKKQLSDMVKKTYMNTLGTKYGIAKDEYLNLFNADIKIEGLEIKNSEDIVKQFEEWKKNNGSLFVELKKDVPKTDNTPLKKPNVGVDLSPLEKIRTGLASKN